MRALRLLPALCLSLACSTSAFSQNLQPESRQEFRRVFGTSPIPPQSPAARLQRLQPLIQSLRQDDLKFAGSQLNEPESINSTALLSILEGTKPRKYVLFWHLVSLDLTAIDHRATADASPNTFQQQFGPARTARALALIHQAIFEAQNVFSRRFESTLAAPGIVPSPAASADVAVTEAAYQLMIWLYPGLNDQGLPDPRRPEDRMTPASSPPAQPCISTPFSLSRYYRCALEKINASPEARNGGIDVGRAIAGRIIVEHSNDGAERPDPLWTSDFVPRRLPSDTDYVYLQWLRDPVSGFQTALGGYWANVKPFALSSAFQFRPDKDPTRDFFVDASKTEDKTTIKSYEAVRKWGRDGRLNDVSKDPPPEYGLYLAQYWAYDGTANLCAPSRLYNQIALAALAHIEAAPDDGYANINLESPVELARFFALTNIALADAAVSAWDAKFHFQYPRPVTYIRAVEQSKAAGGMTAAAPAANAGAATATGGADVTNRVAPQWLPVGAQVTNAEQPRNITPPFPSYPSGHAVFGGALFGMLRQFVKPDVAFNFRSDEFNGKNRDAFNYVRCDEPRSSHDKTPDAFCKERPLTLNCAERENADSRLFMGVHWIFDADDGIVMGNKVAREVYNQKMVGVSTASPGLTNPPTKLFSVSNTGLDGQNRSRDKLLCEDVKMKLPSNLDDVANFGPLVIQEIN